MLRGTTSLVSRPCAQRVAFRPAVAPVRAPVQRGSLQVVAADAKSLPKRTDSAVKRASLAQERRMYNKSRKSAISTRIKKVIKAAEGMMTASISSEADLAPLEKLIGEAYTSIDKAVSKGILHKNNAARKKARCARYKKKVILKANMWQPPADHPDYPKWARLHAKSA
mmetsp:Transcript_72501/g.160150  ORF Transcript_72501/g.160150 Transcript_72501/m.160150 type:complete len:168 (+) Transcript_72501:2-505(+)